MTKYSPRLTLCCLVLCACLLVGCAAHSAPVAAAAPAALSLSPTPSPLPTPSPTPAPAQTPFSVVWMSDTQMYASTYPDILTSMFRYTADVCAAKNVVSLYHTGDMLRSVYYPEQPARVREAAALLPRDLLCVTAAGNHDCGLEQGDYTAYRTYRFDTDARAENAFPGGVSYFTTFSAGGVDILVLSIAYFEEKTAAEWARGVLAAHPGHYAVLLVHSYLDSVWGVKNSGYTSSGETLRDNVVLPSPNLRLVLSGHMRDAEHSVLPVDDDGDGKDDRRVLQLMMNPQENDLGGGGFLRLLRFDAAHDTLRVETYSPYLHESDFPGNDLGVSHVFYDIGIRPFLTGAAD